MDNHSLVADLPIETAEYRWIEIGALLGLSLCFWLAFGAVGVVAGVLTAGVWSLFGVPYAVAVGHVALVSSLAATGVGTMTLAVWGVEVGFGGLVLGSVARRPAPVTLTVVTAASTLALAGLVWAVQSRSVTVAAGVTVVVIALACYSVHRYQLVALGLVSETENSPRSETDYDESVSSPRENP
ncbi:hypothetical protein [Natrialba sp. INN-245]|uniref:hypothetical protein n=1 Tax=Natrialba sp. INN-245 TaxID=2690967 RepID=UPI00130FC43F|nr:hypothetical protein [Natrialba sp. INN-245]MWV41017.1 hypothetical protein [Natrialba sp. INN-245]